MGNKLGRTLRTLRKSFDLTLAEASTQAGISLSFLADVEVGRTQPSLKTLAALAKIYKTTSSAILCTTETTQ